VELSDVGERDAFIDDFRSENDFYNSAFYVLWGIENILYDLVVFFFFNVSRYFDEGSWGESLFLVLLLEFVFCFSVSVVYVEVGVDKVVLVFSELDKSVLEK